MSVTITRRSESTILEYLPLIKKQYPHLSEEDLINICKSPFKLVSSHFRSAELFNIRIKYLGNFIAYPGRVKGMVKVAAKLLERGVIQQQDYEIALAKINNYLVRNNMETINNTINNTTTNNGKNTLG